MEAIITAGGISAPDDPLYTRTGIDKKALIPLAGQPMINWIVEALIGSGLINHIVVVGLRPDELSLSYPSLCLIDAREGLLDNVLAGVDKIREINPQARKILLCSSDIPLITPEIVCGFIEECGTQEADVYYAVVE
jgi:molybdopterin-guanine dinucleotide biosynthesis protein A